MNDQASIPVNYMKYITLSILLIVFLYGIRHTQNTKGTMAVSKTTASEIPIYCVETNNPILAITIDNTWENEDINELLNVMKKHNTQPVIFTTRDWAQKNPDIVKTINAAGFHLILEYE